MLKKAAGLVIAWIFISLGGAAVFIDRQTEKAVIAQAVVTGSKLMVPDEILIPQKVIDQSGWNEKRVDKLINDLIAVKREEYLRGKQGCVNDGEVETCPCRGNKERNCVVYGSWIGETAENWQTERDEQGWWLVSGSVGKDSEEWASKAAQMWKMILVNKPPQIVLDSHEEIVNRKELQRLNHDWTWIHLDTHSDVWLGEKSEWGSLHAGNFVNYLLEKNRVKEFYWVLPDWTRNAQVEPLMWSETETDKSGPYINGDSKTGVIKVTADQLPEMSGRKVVLDIDGDYFGNLGNNTTWGSNWNYARGELEKQMYETARQLTDKHIFPELVFLVRSYGYFPPEDWQLLRKALF